MSNQEEGQDTPRLRRLPRDPLHLDVLNVLRAYVESTKSSLFDPSTLEGFLSTLRDSVESGLKNQAGLYGHSAEAMFGAMVASLGNVKLIKEEDAGPVYASENVVIPDYRLVLNDGSRLLVEVKSYSQKHATADYTVSASYLSALARYAELDGAELALAVYWVRWNVWTLVPLSAFESDRNREKLSMSRAARANKMIALGDVLVGTTPPLTLVVEADPTKPQSDDGTNVRFTIAGVHWECAGEQITDTTEASIASYLAFYGDWDITGQQTVRDGERILAIKTDIGPENGYTSEQGFDFVGHLSGMFSKFYRGAITDSTGKLKHLSVPIEPERVGRMIPKEYKGKALRLWRMQLMPSFPPASEHDSAD